MRETARWEEDPEAAEGNLVEREILTDLVERSRAATPDGSPELDALAAELAGLRQYDGRGTFDVEQRLDAAARSLRQALLVRAHRSTDRCFRSPEHEHRTRLPSGATTKYSYERSADLAWLEERIGRSAPPAPPGWQTRHVAFGSGAAAISGVLQSYLRMIPATGDRPLCAGVWGSYFETDMIFDFRRSPLFSWESVDDLGAAVDSGRFDLLHIEPARYNWDLDTMDVRDFLARWRAHRTGNTRCLVFDTTLSSFTWPTRSVLNGLRDGRPLLVVEVRSGLKLDQQGLELANLGVVSVHSCDEDAGTPTAAQFADYLRMGRAVTGTSVPMDSAAAIDVPLVLDAQLTRRHAGQVFLNNQRLARALAEEDGLFSAIGHPSLAAASAAARGGSAPVLTHAPFVVCRLAEDEVAHHGFLLAVAREEAARLGILLNWGSSFGFRGHRCETILPRLKDRKGLFKIAMGARSGPSSLATVDLFRKLARFRDFASLKAAYPHVANIDLTKYQDPVSRGAAETSHDSGSEPEKVRV
ncbi:hypothetical protein [Streptomyces sp. NPDC058045]|uniref:hypothetical protein n=1 Tax=Streptomyces sp. NPDC058045 TaxID=3346311 RepID=UPI0036E73325